MNRTTLGYFVMIVGSAALIWGIIHLGSKLKAPPDWSGQWQIVDSGKPARNAMIYQSGVYFVLKLEGQPSESYKLRRTEDSLRLVGSHRTLAAAVDRDSWGTQLKLSDPNNPSSSVRLWRDSANAPR